MEFNYSIIYITTIVLFVALVVNTLLLSQYKEYQILHISRHWFKALLFSCIGGLILEYLLPNFSYLQLFFISFFIYILITTFVSWLILNEFNNSGYNFFAPYYPTETAWSSQKKYIFYKDKILKCGYKKNGAFISKPLPDFYLMLTTFISEDKKTLMSVMFMPYQESYIPIVTLFSFTSDGKIILTESNICINVLTQPDCYVKELYYYKTSPIKIINIHNKRIESLNIIDFPLNPKDFIEKYQIDTRNESMKEGLISSPSEIDENGIFTQKAKYKLWFSNYLISALGITTK